MISFLLHLNRLVRGVNLLIIALSMFFFRYFLIIPVLRRYLIFSTLTHLDFALLVAGVVAIAAAGNIINDYYDMEADHKFKPGKNVIGTWISMDNACTIQFVLNAFGIVIGYLLAWKIGNYQLGNIFAITAILLWIYSDSLKKYFLIGNIIIAALSALVFFMPVLFEQKLFKADAISNYKEAAYILIIYAKGYALFAFLISLIREIIKDAEDKDADGYKKMKTLPIILPVWITNAVVIFLILIVMALLAYLQYFYWLNNQKNQFWYVLLLMQVTLMMNLISAFFLKNSQDYKNLSVFMKLNMFFGLFSLPVFYLFSKYL